MWFLKHHHHKLKWNDFCLRSLGCICNTEVMYKWASADSHIPEEKAVKAVIAVLWGLHEDFSSQGFHFAKPASLNTGSETGMNICS